MCTVLKTYIAGKKTLHEHGTHTCTCMCNTMLFSKEHQVNYSTVYTLWQSRFLFPFCIIVWKVFLPVWFWPGLFHSYQFLCIYSTCYGNVYVLFCSYHFLSYRCYHFVIILLPSYSTRRYSKSWNRIRKLLYALVHTPCCVPRGVTTCLQVNEQKLEQTPGNDHVSAKWWVYNSGRDVYMHINGLFCLWFGALLRC